MSLFVGCTRFCQKKKQTHKAFVTGVYLGGECRSKKGKIMKKNYTEIAYTDYEISKCKVYHWYYTDLCTRFLSLSLFLCISVRFRAYIRHFHFATSRADLIKEHTILSTSAQKSAARMAISKRTLWKVEPKNRERRKIKMENWKE